MSTLQLTDDEIIVDESQPLLFSNSRTAPSTSSHVSLTPEIERARLANVLSVNDDATTSTAFEPSVQPKTTRYTSYPAAVFLTVNAALGAGLLNFPYAFNSAGGLEISIIVQLGLLILIVGALFILTHCTNESNSTSFQEMVEFYCGHYTRNIVSVGIILYSYGACLTFLIIIGDQFDRVLASLYGSDFCHSWYMNRDFTMSISSVVLILPLCFSKKIDFLKYSSSCGVLVVGYLIFLTYYEWSTVDHSSVIVKTRPDKWTDVFRVLPVICFGYQCHLSWVPTYAGMKAQNISSPKLIVTIVISLVICCLAYTGVSILGLLTFGTQIDADLMKNYDATKPQVLVGIAAIAFKTVTTYPLLLFCARIALEEFYVTFRGPAADSVEEKKRRSVIVVLWFTSTVVFAILVPDIAVAIDLLGTLAVTIIFVIPGVCLISGTVRKDPNLILIKDKMLCFLASGYILVGAFIFGLTLTQAIVKDFVENRPQKFVPLCV